MMERDATGPSSFINTRCNRVEAFKLAGEQEVKWDGPASDEDNTLYETIRVKIGASVDLIASCSSSGDEAKSPPSEKSPPPLPPLFPKLLEAPLKLFPFREGEGVLDVCGRRGEKVRNDLEKGDLNKFCWRNGIEAVEKTE